MRNLFSILAVASATAILAAGCAKDTQNIATEEFETAIRVSVSTPESTRAGLVEGLTDAAVETWESQITNFDVYVFDTATGYLEASGTGDSSKELVIENITTTGTKQVVVFANVPVTGTANSIPSLTLGNGLGEYNDLAKVVINLADQMPTGDIIKAATMPGLFMSGRVAVTDPLTKGETREVPVTVTRAVAKVVLGEVTFGDDVTLEELLKFNLTGAAVQRAVEAGNLVTGVPAISPTLTYLGGFQNAIGGGQPAISKYVAGLGGASFDLLTGVTTKLEALGDELGITQGLSEILSMPVDMTDGLLDMVGDLLGGVLGTNNVYGLDQTLSEVVNNVTNTSINTVDDLLTLDLDGYWYVLPNGAPTTTPTLLTLAGALGTSQYYYPIVINDPDATSVTATGSATTKDYVKANTIYKINIQFDGFIGSLNPDTLPESANMKITIAAADWTGTVTQNATW